MAVRFSADGQDYTRTTSLGAQTAFTVACWVKISSDRDAVSTVWSLDGVVSFIPRISYLKTAGDGTTLSFVQTDSISTTVTKGSRALTAGTWYYVGVSVNDASGIMLTRALGDTSFTVTTWSDGLSDGTYHDNWRLGESRSGGEWLNGCLAAVKWWGAALSQAELEAEAWTHTPQRTSGLRAWHPLTRAEVVDYSGRGADLTATGAGATVEDGPGIVWRQGRRRHYHPTSIPAEVTPGIVQGVTSIPAPAISAGITIAPPLVLGVTSIPTPEVYTGAPVTQVQPGIVQGVTSIPAPTISTVRNVTVGPGLILGRAVIPGPTVTTPINPGDDITRPGQLSYNGFLMGSTTPYSWQRLTGAYIDMPGIDNGDVPAPSSHGALPGDKLAQARTILFETLIKAPRDEIEQACLDFLNGLPLPDGDAQVPIAIRVINKILIGYGACVARQAPLDKLTRLGHVRGTATFVLANPRLYGEELRTAVVADGAFVEVVNAGNTPTHSLIRCPGPAGGPELVVERILDDGSTDLRVLEFDLEVASGETLTVDPFYGTAAIGGVSQMRRLTSASVGVTDWVLGRAVSEVGYSTVAGGAPPASLLWRDAHI